MTYRNKRQELFCSDSIDFPSLAQQLLRQSDSLLRDWLPHGRVEGHEYVALNPLRQDKHLGSFRINMKTGRWADFATNDRGRDLISLYAYLKGLTQYEAAVKLSHQTGGHHERS